MNRIVRRSWSSAEEEGPAAHSVAAEAQVQGTAAHFRSSDRSESNEGTDSFQACHFCGARLCHLSADRWQKGRHGNAHD